MALTRDFRDTVVARIERDPSFRDELFRAGLECFLMGDVDTGKALLRDYINATVGFGGLGTLTNKPPKSLMRMFSVEGNPQAKNLFKVLNCLQQEQGIFLEVSTKDKPRVSSGVLIKKEKERSRTRRKAS